MIYPLGGFGVVEHTRAAGVPWTPADTTTNLWLDATDTSTFSFSSGAIVSEWRDKSGDGNDVSQGTGGLQPLRVDSERVDFVNGDILERLTHTLLDSSGEHTIVIVHDIFDPTASSHNFPNILRVRSTESFAAQRRPYFFYAKAVDLFKHSYNSTDGSEITASTSTGKSVISGVITAGADNLMYINGDLKDTFGVSLKTSTSSLSLHVGDINAQDQTVMYNQIIMIKGAVTTDIRQRLEGWAAWEHGTEGDLISGHPFEFAPPFI